MVRKPNEPRDAPGKYGALAREGESGVESAWKSHDAPSGDLETGRGGRAAAAAAATERDELKPRGRKSKRPPPPPGKPKPKLVARVCGFFYNNLWIVGLAWLFGAMGSLQRLEEPDFDDATNAFYFIAITATTVGYGDLTPATKEGKIFVMMFIVSGVALAGIFMTKVTDWILAAQEHAVQRAAERNKAQVEKDMLKLKAQLGAQTSESEKASALLRQKELAEKSIRKTMSPRVRALIIVVCVVASGSIAMRYLEDISFVDGCYWAIVTSTTVGYGDVTPQTANGKIFASFYAFLTIGVMAWAVSTIASAAVDDKVEGDQAMQSFKLTPEWLAEQGGEKGYVNEHDFLKAMLVAMGKADKTDLEEIDRKFEELDVNGDRTLDAQDLLGSSR